MKPRMRSPQCGESGLLDLFVMVIAVALIIAVFLPMVAKRSARSSKIGCVNYLKQIGLSYRLWSGDNGDKYPAQVSTNLGGTMELIANGFVFPDFLVMSNELGTTRIIVCPQDAKRTYATNFSALTDTNLSYFTVPEADENNPELWLSGDRNLTTNSVALPPGLFTMPTNRVMGWTAQIHKYQGNLVLADGSVQQYSNARLHQSATNALRAYFATTNVSFRLAIP